MGFDHSICPIHHLITFVSRFQMHIRLRGLGGVTSALSMLMSRAINDDPWNVIPIAEAQIITLGREMIANVTVPIFSLV